VAGDQDVIAKADGIGDGWEVDPSTEASALLEGYRAEAVRADAIITAHKGDDPLAWWPTDPEGGFDEQFLQNVRDVLLHVIAETACHAGHLDAVRELIDGRQWMVNT
jgi:hypothetical protein